MFWSRSLAIYWGRKFCELLALFSLKLTPLIGYEGVMRSCPALGIRSNPGAWELARVDAARISPDLCKMDCMFKGGGVYLFYEKDFT